MKNKTKTFSLIFMFFSKSIFLYAIAPPSFRSLYSSPIKYEKIEKNNLLLRYKISKELFTLESQELFSLKVEDSPEGLTTLYSSLVIATHNNRIIGFINYLNISNTITRLVVDQGYQGNGIGSKLMDMALSDMFNDGNTVKFSCTDNSLPFYKKYTFRKRLPFNSYKNYCDISN